MTFLIVNVEQHNLRTRYAEKKNQMNEIKIETSIQL